MVNFDGMIVGLDNFVEGIEVVVNGEDIDYQGVFLFVNFDENGDLVEVVYFIWEFDVENNVMLSVEMQLFVGENFDGDGLFVDSGLGGFDCEMLVGILLFEIGDFVVVGVLMIQVVQIFVMQVNDVNLVGFFVNV